MIYWVYLLTGILCEVAGTTGMRAFVYSNPALSQTSATVGIVISYFLVSRAVEKIPMSIAYAIWSGLGTGGVSLLSWFFFREAHAPAQNTRTLSCHCGHALHQPGQKRTGEGKVTIPDISLRQELIIAILWLFGAVATDMVAISALVLSHGFRRWKWALLSIAAIFLSFFCMRRVVLEIPLGVAYALWCVFGIFGTLAIGAFIFHQHISRQKQAGIVLLAIGVICMSLS